MAFKPRRPSAKAIAAFFEDRATFASVTETLADHAASIVRAANAAHSARAARAAEAYLADCAADATAGRVAAMDEGLDLLLASGSNRRAAGMTVLAILSSSPHTREDCRNWCAGNLTWDDAINPCDLYTGTSALDDLRALTLR